MSQISSSSFANQMNKFSGPRTGLNNFRNQIDETNKRIDGVLKRRDLTSEQREKIEAFRKQFNEHMDSVGRSSSDQAKIMGEYRDARKTLSDGLTDLLGGPRAG